jgi:hypothetical protein
MLRKTVVLLIALNLLWWVWAQDWLAGIGLPSTPAGEPEFLERQIHPEALRVQPLPPGAAAIQTAPAVPDASAGEDAQGQTR